MLILSKEGNEETVLKNSTHLQPYSVQIDIQKHNMIYILFKIR